MSRCTHHWMDCENKHCRTNGRCYNVPSEVMAYALGEPPVVDAVPTCSAIPPDDWECPECGTDSQACAVIKPIEEMQNDERLTLEAYGKSEDQFLIAGGEIVLCGCCHGSHWRAPNQQL